MSGPLAIAAVTVALKDLLNNGLINHDLAAIGSYTVSASPPDRIASGSDEPNQLNLFLYQVSPNLGWRNAGLPGRDSLGGRVGYPPLALDLHYLLSAHGSQDMNAEILLGFAMQLLHENPVLTREQLRIALDAPSPVDGIAVPGVFGSLSAVDLADQVEMVKISPLYLNPDELSKLWTAMQARYRLSMAYTVSVVLIQATGAAHAPLPVLKRGQDDRGPAAIATPYPALSMARSALADALPAVRLGDGIVILGSHLQASPDVAAVLENIQAGQALILPVSAGPREGSLLVQLPSLAERPQAIHEWASGILSLSLRVSQASLPIFRSNTVPIALAPIVALAAPASPAVCNPGDIVQLDCVPRLQARQLPACSLLFGSRTLVPTLLDTPLDPLAPTAVSFEVPNVPAGEYLLRLRVDGIDSLPVTVDPQSGRLDFDSALKVTVP
ncbi:DUF4255 domain-containing protein [Chitinimonas arctica]|uniref:DUF4255 domain-containing protein n=1 Tax=Chitinimonas arctica TaxID=2594795 RepID=A0A516SLH9_9NEIS|nr:DUF4255 domain-containing protein [Chitinimonas arctica]QDQ29005.1 DUF4255 domain-containing protein [Chitinimonas arctica]